MQDDCLTSPNYPDEYDVKQACVIEIMEELVGFFFVHQFETEESFDFLCVNEVEYSGTVGTPRFHGVVPNGSIFWTADYIYNEAGFKICRTNVSATVTTTTTTFHVPNMSDQSYIEFWGVTEGDCYMDTSGCIASPNYPFEYGNGHVCLIELTDLWEGDSIDVVAFRTYDYLYVNDVGYRYWGSYIQGLQGMLPTTTIMWSANQYSTSTGWKIFRDAAAPVEWVNWTCTLLGDDCTRPSNNINPNTSSSTLYSASA